MLVFELTLEKISSMCDSNVNLLSIVTPKSLKMVMDSQLPLSTHIGDFFKHLVDFVYEKVY